MFITKLIPLLNLFSVYGFLRFLSNANVVSVPEYRSFREEIENGLSSKNVFYNDIVHFRMEKKLISVIRYRIILSILVNFRNITRFLFRIVHFFILITFNNYKFSSSHIYQDDYFTIGQINNRYKNALHKIANCYVSISVKRVRNNFTFPFTKRAVGLIKHLRYSSAENCALYYFFTVHEPSLIFPNIDAEATYIVREGRSTYQRIWISVFEKICKTAVILDHWFIEEFPSIPRSNKVLIPRCSYVSKSFIDNHTIERFGNYLSRRQLGEKFLDTARYKNLKIGLLVGDCLGRFKASVAAEYQVLSSLLKYISDDQISVRCHPQFRRHYDNSRYTKSLVKYFVDEDETIFFGSIHTLILWDWNSTMFMSAIEAGVKVIVVIPYYDAGVDHEKLPPIKFVKWHNLDEKQVELVTINQFCSSVEHYL